MTEAFARWLVPAAVAGLLAYSGFIDVNRYFLVHQRDSSTIAEHSGTETLIGSEARELPTGTRIFIDDRWVNHPTIRFLAPAIDASRAFDRTLLPLSESVPTALFVGREQADVADAVRRMYPNAVIKPLSSPYGGEPLAYMARMSPADIESVQGVVATYSSVTESRTENVTGPNIDPDRLPLQAPFHVDWKAVLIAPAYGEYGFLLSGLEDGRLDIDGQPIASAGAAAQVTLARGAHDLAATGTMRTPQPARLVWRPPNSTAAVPIPRQRLFVPPVTNNGLLGHYYPNGSWTGPVAFEQIDLAVSRYFQVTPLPEPFSVRWTGQIAAPVSGAYRLGLNSHDSSSLVLDNQPVLQHQGDGGDRENIVNLSAGLHDVQLDYEAHSGYSQLGFYWQPPGRQRQIVPTAFLFPSKATGQSQPLPDLPVETRAATQPAPTAAQPALPATALTADRQINLAALIGDDSRPYGVATDGDGNLYVADLGRHAVEKFDPSGELLWSAARTRQFDAQQISSVALATDGTLLVLDSETSAIYRLSADGKLIGKLGAGPVALYNPRGLAVVANGDILVADTGGSRVQRLGADGELKGSIGTAGDRVGQVRQPTASLPLANGDVVVVDPTLGKMARFASFGAVQREWPFPSNPTVGGPQLALDPSGEIWVTNPQDRELWLFDPDGKLKARYSLGASPSGIALSGDALLVSEPAAKRIERFIVNR